MTVLGRELQTLDPAMRKMLGAVALATLFEEYDTGILSAALKQIAHDLLIPEERLGLDLAWIRAGALPAFLFVPLADRVGRRPMFLWSIALMGVLTFATAFSQTLAHFIFFQAFARTFALAGAALAFVIVSEEVPAERRGLAMGVLAAVGASGHGVSAGLYSQIDILPYGWRFLYAVGILPVLFLPWIARRVPETKRFKSSQLADAGLPRATGWLAPLAPLAALVASHPGRAAGIALAGFLAACAGMPTFQFASYFVQTARGFSPGQFSLMVIVGGGVGILGNIAAGRLGDAFGRKRVGFALLALFPVWALGLYRAPSVPMIVFSWVGTVFFLMGGRLILRALSTELFPTNQRGAASGVFSVLEAAGAVVGLLLAHWIGTGGTDSISRTTPIIASISVLAALLLLTFPETKARELEEIA